MAKCKIYKFAYQSIIHFLNIRHSPRRKEKIHMGSGASKQKSKSWISLSDLTQAKERYTAEGSLILKGGDDLADEHAIEFRVLLDEPLALMRFREFGTIEQCETLKEWENKLERCSSSASKFYSISDSFAQQGSTNVNGELHACFRKLYFELFLNFRNSEEYLALCEQLTSRNVVGADDFDYFTTLGRGAFGMIFSCRRRSTGLMYAMKVQPKKLLLRSNQGKPATVMTEFLASTGCPSPFLCQAVFAFQTTNLVFLALPLYFNGDLRRMLDISPTGFLTRDAVQFIATELSCAIIFLHMHGLIHRDLKPENIFFNSDGHVVLGDFGAMSGRCSACLTLQWVLALLCICICDCAASISLCR